jgi:uncharacterized protein YuzB (UPF0349 family)
VYVCTNISCSLLGADEFFEAMLAAAEGDPDVDVRSFECLGGCDIAPMASVNGEYVGPLDLADAERIIEDLRLGRPVLEHKQLRYRRSADSAVTDEERDFGPPDRDETPMADTAALGPEGDTEDRPGPTAAIEMTTDQLAGHPEPEAHTDQDSHPAGQDHEEAEHGGPGEAEETV